MGRKPNELKVKYKGRRLECIGHIVNGRMYFNELINHPRVKANLKREGLTWAV